jgi:hypothetical protein
MLTELEYRTSNFQRQREAGLPQCIHCHVSWLYGQAGYGHRSVRLHVYGEQETRSRGWNYDYRRGEVGYRARYAGSDRARQ